MNLKRMAGAVLPLLILTTMAKSPRRRPLIFSAKPADTPPPIKCPDNIVTHTYENQWFQKLSANASGMISQRICLKKNGQSLTKLDFDQTETGLKPEFRAFRNKMREDIKMHAQLAKHRSIAPFRIRKFASLENKKQAGQWNH